MQIDRSDIEKPTLTLILFVVAEYFGVPTIDLKSARKDKKVYPARQMYCLIARELTDKSYHQIALKIGGRDHSTVVHGIRRARERIEADEGYAALYRQCMRHFGRLV